MQYGYRLSLEREKGMCKKTKEESVNIVFISLLLIAFILVELLFVVLPAKNKAIREDQTMNELGYERVSIKMNGFFYDQYTGYALENDIINYHKNKIEKLKIYDYCDDMKQSVCKVIDTKDIKEFTVIKLSNNN